MVENGVVQCGVARDKSGLTEKEFLAKYDPSKYDKGPYLAVDSLLFAINEVPSGNVRKLSTKSLQVLLVRRTEHPFLDKWALPGTFPRLDETLEEACIRSLKLKSNLGNIHLEQLYTFSAIGRDPRTRIVSTSYMGLIVKARYEHEDMNPTAQWFDVDKIRADEIGFDHYSIIQYGLERLRGKLEYTDIAFSLLPEKFTLAELQQVYEVILAKKLLKANFRRIIRDKVKCAGEYQMGAFRPAMLYRRK